MKLHDNLFDHLFIITKEFMLCFGSGRVEPDQSRGFEGADDRDPPPQCPAPQEQQQNGQQDHS